MSESVMTSNNEPLAADDGTIVIQRRRYLKFFDIGVMLITLLVFFLFLQVLLRVVFPQGSRLVEMTTVESGTGPNQVGNGSIEFADGADDFNVFKAFLGDIRRDVKIRPADGVAWTTARKGSEVRDRDAVQTFSNSRARVDFTSDNRLRIGQNSLVVFRNGAADPFLARREPAAVVMEGELSGEVNADYGAFAIEFPAGLVELTADGSSLDAVNFRVGVNPDKSSTIAVYTGEADINIAGEHYQISANEGITFTEEGRTAGVVALPALPTILEPGNNSAARFLSMPPRISFRWGAVANASLYRIEIASDPDFQDIVVDDALDRNSFVHGNLLAGDYYWRVSARNGWVQGPVTAARRFNVVQDTAPPALELLPVERLANDLFLLRGSTARNARVFAFGKPVSTSPDGRFEYEFEPAPGTQTIVVESVDDVGNTTYKSQLLHVPGSAGRSSKP